jgi:hypothetical protein
MLLVLQRPNKTDYIFADGMNRSDAYFLIFDKSLKAAEESTLSSAHAVRGGEKRGLAIEKYAFG